MQKIYYSQHLYQYKKIHWSRFALGENRRNWWDWSCLTQFFCSMTLEVQFPWFLKQLILDTIFLYLLMMILHRPVWPQLGWSSVSKTQKDCKQGDPKQWLHHRISQAGRLCSGLPRWKTEQNKSREKDLNHILHLN